MGHANVANLSRFFLRRMYAKGSLSIAECAQALAKSGEKMHASEGDYEDDFMLAMGVVQIIHYLTRKRPTEHGYSSPRGGGPWIRAVLVPRLPGKKIVSPTIQNLLAACGKEPDSQAACSVTADALEEAGMDKWARHVRTLPLQRKAYRLWMDEHEDPWEDEEVGKAFDSIRWVFAPGWRDSYRAIPILSNITN
jgi:hypothetical protein